MRRPPHTIRVGVPLALVAAGMGCSSSHGGTDPDAGRPKVMEGACQAESGASPDFLPKLGCTPDFQALASEPLDTSLPGARSVKVVLDRADGNALYFQNSVRYKIHYEFASTHLSGQGKPIVPSLSLFNATEYYASDRRFILGAVTYYEGPQEWVLEIAPYDTASAAMITTLHQAVAGAAFFGGALGFHPTSDAVAAEAGKLAGVRVVTTADLYAAIDYQPLSLGRAIGRLRFTKAATFASQYLSYEDIVVLDQAPNDIPVLQGLITEEFQTPLSHVNVLSRNRKTPNMGLRQAMTNPALRALEGQLVELAVEASTWRVRQASSEEALAFWAEHKPAPVTLPALDLGVTDLVDAAAAVAQPSADLPLRDAIKKAVRAFGGKVAHYAILARTGGLPVLPAFGVPVFYYDQFMRENGFYARVEGLLQDAAFNADSAVRDAALAALRADMMKAPVNDAFQDLLRAKIASGYAAGKVRFRTSTNSEDLEGFPCAGCYESHTGDPAKWNDVLDAIRETYASAWLFRTFEERSYYGVKHDSVGMALLVHKNFPQEEANGVAVSANPFDPSGLNPAFYVNVQTGGDAEVVHPPPGIKSDEFLYFFNEPNQPVNYLSHSNLIDKGTTVLSRSQTHELGVALDTIHRAFSPAYGPAAGHTGWYAMDVEFKFDDEAAPGQPATLYVKQARPYPKPAEP